MASTKIRYTWWALVVALIVASIWFFLRGKRDPAIDPSLGTVLPVPDARTENGWPLYEVKEEGFALALPPDWRQFDMNPVNFEKKFSQALKEDPDLGAIHEIIRQQIKSGMKFFAFHKPSLKSGFATNLNVLRVPVPDEATLDEVVAENLTQLDGLTTVVKPFTHERVRMATGDRERIRYQVSMQNPGGKSATVAITQFVLVKGTDSYFVTFTTLPDRKAQYTDTFEKIGKSFRFID
jgi:hypothetical protein